MTRYWQRICSHPTFAPRIRTGLVLLIALAALPGIAAAADSCPADLDGDGSVGSSDLLIVLGCWGPVTSTPCAAAEFNGDRDVGCFDLEFLLGNWGACGCFGDLDNDGTVGSSDLVLLLAAFGEDCRSDLDRDGTVGQGDLDLLLDAWGTCPG